MADKETPNISSLMFADHQLNTAFANDTLKALSEGVIDNFTSQATNEIICLSRFGTGKIYVDSFDVQRSDILLKFQRQIEDNSDWVYDLTFIPHEGIPFVVLYYDKQAQLWYAAIAKNSGVEIELGEDLNGLVFKLISPPQIVEWNKIDGPEQDVQGETNQAGT